MSLKLKVWTYEKLGDFNEPSNLIIETHPEIRYS